MLRLTWAQPEDLVAHALAARRLDGCDVDDDRRPVGCRRRQPRSPRTVGATPEPATPRPARPRPRSCSPSSTRVAAARRAARRRARRPRGDRARWHPVRPRRRHQRRPRRPGARRLARAGGRLPARQAGREDPPRRASGRSPSRPATGRCSGYFTAIGLDPDVAAAHPWNRASRTTSLVENIAGMPEDDDLNFALLALTARRAARRGADHRRRRRSPGSTLLPGKRVFTAERIAYRNLLDGYEPDEAAAGRQPVPGLDRRPDPHRRLRLGLPRRSGAGGRAWRGRTAG